MPTSFRAASILLGCCALLSAQSTGTTPKAKPEDYPVQARAGEVVIAAEYLVNTLPGKGTSFLAPGYLVIEVAAYAPKYRALAISSGQFRLRMDGKKAELSPDSPEMVAASLKYPEWEGHSGPSVEGQAGPVIFGRTQPVGRFPGDPGSQTGRNPVPSQTPDASTGSDQPASQTAPEAAVELAFPDGAAKAPLSGYLYFLCRKKPASIRSLELVWLHGEERTTLKLF